MKGIDYSLFSTGNKPVPVATFQKIRKMLPPDMLLNIPGAWHGGSRHTAARQSLANGRDAGFIYSGTYTALNTLPGSFSIEWAQQVVGPTEWDKLSFIALDVELQTTPDIVYGAIETAKAMGVRPIIYSARWAWERFMANTREFAQYPLWNAFYDSDPDVDFLRNPFGGWQLSELVGEQYTNTTNIDGFGFDFNFFTDDKVLQMSPAPDIPPLVQLAKAWKDDMANLAVNAADLIHTPLDTPRLALHSIYTSKRTEAWKALIGR